MARLPEGYAIRLATNDDCETVKVLVNAVLQEYGLNPDPGHADKGLNDIEASFEGGRFELLVSADDTIVGTVGVLKKSHSVCELTKMFLQKSERGKGFGRMLLRRATKFAKENGFRRIELETDTALKEAIGLYKSFGFVDSAECDETKRCNTLMHLTL